MLTQARANFRLSRVSANGYHGSGLATEILGSVTFIGERRRTQEDGKGENPTKTATRSARARLTDHYFSNVIGIPLESTIAVHHLIFGGVLDG